MARIKQNPLIPNLSGVIGGQSIARTQRTNYVRNITQTNTSPTVKQSKQRVTTAFISQSYKALSAANKLLWENASSSYLKENRKGEVKDRNGFETFSFLNQNNLLLGLSIAVQPPTFQAVFTPTVLIDSGTVNKLIINSAVTGYQQQYLIFANPYLGIGETMNFGKGLIVGKITQLQLEANIDILPFIKSTFGELNSTMTIGFYLSAIVNSNGNRDQFPNMYVTPVTSITDGLGLDVFTYFPYTTNANDYFGNNNPDYNGASIGTSGIISGSVDITTTGTSYITLPSNNQLNFNTGSGTTPFTICMWVKSPALNGNVIIDKTQHSGPLRIAGYLLMGYAGKWNSNYGANNPTAWSPQVIGSTLVNNTQTFIAMGYLGLGKYFLIIDTTYYEESNLYVPNTGFTPDAIKFHIGKANWTGQRKFSGSISELTFINSAITTTQAETIRQANLNGQTIIDIN